MEPLAEKIKMNPNIRGIPSQNSHHVISLFTDDLILTLTDPAHSLPKVHEALNLNLFGQVANLDAPHKYNRTIN